MTVRDPVGFVDFDVIERWRAERRPHALLDVRERGEYALGQIPGACPLPRGLIEILLPRLVPWKDVPLVLYSNRGHRSALAGQTCHELGYRDVQILHGGIRGWADAGRTPAYGVNVVGKTFGEKLSVSNEVEQLAPDDIAALAEAGKVLIFDARTESEYAKGHIPGAYHVPGGELVPTVLGAGIDKVDRSYPIVVHCAGRTRSILGAYLLRQAGFDNVYALRNGTMAWVMSGRELERELRHWDAEPSAADGEAQAATFARDFVRDTDAWPVSAGHVKDLVADGRPCYLIDVRLIDEFADGHIPDAVWCPAGQLANAVDEQIPVRDALLVCYSTEETRARIGAGLLSRIGYRNVGWLTGGLTGWVRGGGAVATGSPHAYLDELSFPGDGVPVTTVDELRAALRDGTCVLVDVRRSSEYALRHIPGSVWVPRGDLERRIGKYADPGARVVVVSDRELRSTLAARTLAELGYRDVSILGGGLNRWIDSGGETEDGLAGADVSLTEAKEDAELVAPRPRLLERSRDDMVRYLDWEERLGTELLAGEAQ